MSIKKLIQMEQSTNKIFDLMVIDLEDLSVLYFNNNNNNLKMPLNEIN